MLTRCFIAIANASQKKRVPFSMVMENVELMHEFVPIRTARMKFGKETEEKSRRGRVNKLCMWKIRHARNKEVTKA